MREYFSGKACLLSAMAALVLAACGGAESNFMRPDTGAATTPPPVTPPPVDGSSNFRAVPYFGAAASISTTEIAVMRHPPPILA